MTALLEFLDERPPKRVLDFGCGVGWLSYRLAAHGYETFGVDIRREGPSGLEAARGYLGLGAGFECIRGEMERPPFQDGRFDLIVANASIHFSRSLPESFAQVLRLLVPGGVFVMMNSPVHKDPTSARRAEGDAQRNLIRLGSSPEMAASYRHFSRAEVEKAFRDAFGSVTELRWDPGLAFRLVRRTKSVLLRMELASFPIYEGRAAEPVRARDVSHRESLRLIDDPAGGA